MFRLFLRISGSSSLLLYLLLFDSRIHSLLQNDYIITEMRIRPGRWVEGGQNRQIDRSTDRQADLEKKIVSPSLPQMSLRHRVQLNVASTTL